MKYLITGFAMLLMATPASATVLFSEDFESDLSVWTGTSGGTHNGTIVSDPLQSDKALTFTALNSAGDIFTTATLFSSVTGNYTLSYDYLGTCSTGNCGGFIGYSFGLPGTHVWLGGSSTVSGAADVNADTGDWVHVELSFNAGSTPIHLMIEDFSGSGGAAGDAYFDNIALTDGASIPEPSVLMLLGVGLLGLAFKPASKKTGHA